MCLEKLGHGYHGNIIIKTWMNCQGDTIKGVCDINVYIVFEWYEVPVEWML